MVLGGDRDSRWIDFDITMNATEAPVKFGDTKEGSFGVRVADTMRVYRKRGGQIVNSEGQTDDDAWGSRPPGSTTTVPSTARTSGSRS